MAKPTQALVADSDIFMLTKKGEAELRGANTTVSGPVLELLVRIDGKATAAELGGGMSTVSMNEVKEMLGRLLLGGMIEVSNAQDDALEFGGFSGMAAPLAPSPGAMTKAKGEASAGFNSLEQQGYYVRIARQPADRPKLPKDRKPHAVIIEDDPHLSAFLKHFMSFEGFEATIAGNREEVVQTLRKPPPPDLILLDVVLPDANGFDILMKIRQHRALCAVPVIMLTAKTTRDAVLKGLAGGADGYITKPFQTDVLVKAIKTMFGVDHGAADPWKSHGA